MAQASVASSTAVHPSSSYCGCGPSSTPGTRAGTPVSDRCTRCDRILRAPSPPPNPVTEGSDPNTYAAMGPRSTPQAGADSLTADLAGLYQNSRQLEPRRPQVQLPDIKSLAPASRGSK
ncbi:hypothetical protein FDECE_6221 [Fusarium decemcellulare]|nr:hypothetical protein FDECE_6221 [Fusarium decemcellulare]